MEGATEAPVALASPAREALAAEADMEALPSPVAEGTEAGVTQARHLEEEEGTISSLASPAAEAEDMAPVALASPARAAEEEGTALAVDTCGVSKSRVNNKLFASPVLLFTTLHQACHPS